MAILSIADALKSAIAEEMRSDSTVFCIGEDVDIPGGMGGAFTVTKGLADEFGFDRVINTPISEIMIAGVCVGAAMSGMRPVADLQYCDFLFCMMDQLINQAAKMCYMSGGKVKVPMVMRAPCGASNRGAQHAQSLESYFRPQCVHRVFSCYSCPLPHKWNLMHPQQVPCHYLHS
jgi:pyruvate/2-oxoglutarate/acetoin dehydrogenase E1 component